MLVSMGTLLPEVVELAHGANFAALTVHLGGGQAMTHLMWVDADEDCVLINTEVHRDKFRVLQEDPRATVTIWAADNPYHYVEVRGQLVETIGGERARAHIDQLARKYLGRDYDPAAIQSERVILRIAPESQHVH
jgi:general stress protein 26